jgi:hypothetical protein
MMKMKQEKDKSMCAGCSDDFYNHGGATGQVNDCWHFDSATIVKGFEVGTWENPPYIRKLIIKKLSCFHFASSQRCFIKLDESEQNTKKRFWTMKNW